MSDEIPEDVYCLRCKSTNVRFVNDIRAICEDCGNIDDYGEDSSISQADRERFQKKVDWIPF
jgi:transposase-like protein